jgi:signal transduction histidine kinase
MKAALQRVKDRIERSWPTASLRTYLVAVMLLAILPIAAFMTAEIYGDVRERQAQIDAELSRSAAALSLSVERELASSLEALNVLSQSELFQQGRIAALGRLLHGRPRRDWDSIFLLDRDGSPILDTAGPGLQDPTSGMRELHRQVLRRQQPVIWAIGGPGADHRGIAVAMPVKQGGQLRFVLGARMSDDVWRRLVTSASVPQGGNASMFDAQHLLISHSRSVVVPAGSALADDALAQMGERPSGTHRSTSPEGQAVFAAWQTIPLAGWHARVWVPAAPIDSARRQSIAAALSASGSSLLLGLLLAALVARRIARPLQRLAAGGAIRLRGHVAVREVAQLRDALEQARQQDAESTAALRSAAEELRSSQHLVELAQEAGRVGFFHYDFRSDRLSWTPGQCKLFGVAALRRGTLQDWFSRIAPEDRDRAEREFWTACALLRDRETLQYCVMRPDGSSHWFSSRIVLRYDTRDRAVEMTGVTVDMSEERRAERERAQLTERALAARRDAEAASRAKDEFLTMLSHELRNPLGAICAAVDVLDVAPPGSPGAAEARAIIGRQSRNLAHMMNDLLDVGRVIAGKIMLEQQPVNLAPVVQRVAETLALTGQSKEHGLRLDLHDAWVEGDAVRLEQVATNLLVNAIKYTPAGRDIQATVRRDHGSCVLQVQDAGMGIPETLLPHIFELFVQGQRTLDRRSGGLGIGLTLVRRLAQLHGGTVSVESSAEGSRFTVRLPAIDVPPPSREDALPPSRRRSVLVVEDNEDVLAALRSKLEMDGHTVSTAADGLEGLARLLKLRPEVSIVDIGLPGLTGFELARRARAAGYAGRMIALSGYGQARDERKALMAGFDAYLVKPVDGLQLRASLSAE